MTDGITLLRCGDAIVMTIPSVLIDDTTCRDSIDIVIDVVDDMGVRCYLTGPTLPHQYDCSLLSDVGIDDDLPGGGDCWCCVVTFTVMTLLFVWCYPHTLPR